jgi:hypothetical protein
MFKFGQRSMHYVYPVKKMITDWESDPHFTAQRTRPSLLWPTVASYGMSTITVSNFKLTSGRN